MPGITMTGTRARQVSSSSTSEPRFGAGLPGVYPEAKVLVDNYNGSIQGADDDHNRYKVVRGSTVPYETEVLTATS